jgi:hypothetical protein
MLLLSHDPSRRRKSREIGAALLQHNLIAAAPRAR